MKTRYYAALALALPFVAGCELGPPYQEPIEYVPPGWERPLMIDPDASGGAFGRIARELYMRNATSLTPAPEPPRAELPSAAP
jgi:hypothetical protein